VFADNQETVFSIQPHPIRIFGESAIVNTLFYREFARTFGTSHAKPAFESGIALTATFNVLDCPVSPDWGFGGAVKVLSLRDSYRLLKQSLETRGQANLVPP